MEHVFAPGSKVMMLEGGQWAGPYTVVDMPGRTYNHVVLRGKYCDFEVYNDYPYNIREYVAESTVSVGRDAATEDIHEYPRDEMRNTGDGSLADSGVELWCFVCNRFVDIEEYSRSPISEGAILVHTVNGVTHDPSISDG